MRSCVCLVAVLYQTQYYLLSDIKDTSLYEKCLHFVGSRAITSKRLIMLQNIVGVNPNHCILKFHVLKFFKVKAFVTYVFQKRWGYELLCCMPVCPKCPLFCLCTVSNSYYLLIYLRYQHLRKTFCQILIYPSEKADHAAEYFWGKPLQLYFEIVSTDNFLKIQVFVLVVLQKKNWVRY